MINCTIIGASGYAGAELVRILLQHPNAKIQHLCAKFDAGKKYGDLFPYYEELKDMVIEDDDPEIYVHDTDIVFLALPHGLSVPHVVNALNLGKKVVDLGADFRFNNVDVYEEWYGVKHDARELAEKCVYGMPEINRHEIKGQSLISNPGCYPTGATLALYPLVEAGIIELDSIIIDSKSGVTGAGRGLNVGSLYCEANESIRAYNIAKHRHTPEIEKNLAHVAGCDIKLSFTPHLTPMNRGILTTAYAKLNDKGLKADIGKIFEDKYAGETFIRLLPQGKYPETKWVQGTNLCYIGYQIDPRVGRIIVSSAIDNLVKGAAGQAVQNMNILFDLPEDTGLKIMPIYP